jgi:outer membrane protein insertion porin family
MVLTALWLLSAPLTAGSGEETSPDGLPIASVDVAGAVTLTRAEILSVVRARPGQPFRAEQTAEDTRRIARLEAVESAYYSTEIADGKVRLTYVAVERNLVRSIALKGNRQLSNSFLLKQLPFNKGDYLDIFALHAGTDALLDAYKKKGFPWATVTLEETSALGHVAYRIDEGARPKIAGVKYEGNRSIPDRDLKKVAKSRKRKLLLFSVYYSPEQLEEDTRSILEAYQRRSFLDAQVRSEVSFNESRSKAYIRFQIVEGPAYLVSQIRYTGNTFFTEEQIREELKLREDYYYSEAWADFDVKKIRSKYAAEGFINATVTQHRTFLPDARVNVEFQIDPGARYRIGEVIITGNETLQDRSIRRVLDEEGFTPGEWYNADIAAGTGEGELERVVRQTVVTQSAVITPVGEDEGVRDALVTVKEGQTGSVMLGAGLASDSGVIGQISLDQRNFDITDLPESWGELFTGKAFRGAGQRLRIAASPGTRVSTYLISFTEPYLYDQPMALNVAGSIFERGRESYDESRLTGTFGLDKRYPDDWRRGISFRAESVGVDDLDTTAPQEIVDVRGDNMLFGTRFYIGRDTTDSRFRPSRGYNFDMGYEQVFGDHTFGILTATQRWYRTLYEDLAGHKTVLETKVHAGTVVGDAPPFEKFYVGGIGSMRGFDYRGISPRSGVREDPIGSDWVLLGNFEVAVPLGSETFSWLFFTDVGTIEDGVLRASVGTGLQIQIPQFFGPVPMRFELGMPIMKDGQDETQVFSFSVGALF